MGEVYQAWHTQTGRVVALKRLLPLARVNNEQLLRFIREVHIMNELNHPGLVRLFETGMQDENSYFVSEFIADGNLSQFISSAGEPLLAVAESVRLITQCLQALSVLHRNGYVHRDIKPENILIQRAQGETQPKLADFGLARSYERHGGTITKSGECAGTLMFMPPEQVLGFKNSKPPVDIYAMGVTLYFLLTGCYSLKFPTQAERERGIYITKDPLLMILEDDPIPVQNRRADLPAELCRVVNKAVSKDSASRYSTTDDFAAELARALA
jgi:serine/threonine protein kinase